VQHKLDKQFAYNIEESIYRRGPKAPFILSPTPTLRPKRATRAPVRFNRTVGKAIGKKNKGKRRQI
jgi:hypothetical protein